MTFRTALSGLNAAGTELQVIGNNVANSSTTGFKESRAEFSDIFAASNLGVASTAIGNGVQVSGVSQQFTQGNINFTDNSLDLAVNGEGFFVVSDAGVDIYTRAGQFNVDRDGFVVNSQSQRLRAFTSDADGVLTGAQGDLQLDTSNIAPNATDEINVNLNLDASATVPTVTTFDVNDARSFNSSTSLTVFDSLGTEHLASLYYVKTSENNWDTFTFVDGVQVDQSINGVIETPAVPATAGTFTSGTVATVTDFSADTASFDVDGITVTLDQDYTDLATLATAIQTQINAPVAGTYTAAFNGTDNLVITRTATGATSAAPVVNNFNGNVDGGVADIADFISGGTSNAGTDATNALRTADTAYVAADFGTDNLVFDVSDGTTTDTITLTSTNSDLATTIGEINALLNDATNNTGINVRDDGGGNLEFFDTTAGASGIIPTVTFTSGPGGFDQTTIEGATTAAGLDAGSADYTSAGAIAIFDYSGDSISFTVDGNTVQLDADYTNVAGVVAEVQADLDALAAGTYTVSADGSNNLVITTVATGSGEAAPVIAGFDGNVDGGIATVGDFATAGTSVAGTDLEPAVIVDDSIQFNNLGELIAGGTITIPNYNPGGGAADLTLTINLGDTTQFGNGFSVNSLSQDGFTTGRLSGIDINDTGIVTSRFTNGQTQILGQVALANFSNPQGLRQLGDTTWGESFDSGAPLVSAPGTSSLGLIQAGALEGSNVDLTQQLVNIITAQRNFQANAQVISAADTVTQTIINIR